jgi:tripartite-type tricarboxylate transporter receptor subunit TctC
MGATLNRRQLLASSALLVGAWAWSSNTKAGLSFPQRAITLIDPATAGSSTDFFLRPLAQEMAKLLGQPVIVENKPGAGGALAAEFLARAKPDGYTLGLAAVSTHVTNPLVNKAVRYDPINDFAPITMMVTLPSATVVRADSPFRSLKDLVEAARIKPQSISVASPGVGSAGHILLEHFSHLAGVRFSHIPYRGSSGMFNDLLGGQLDVASDNLPALLPHIRSGTLRALAIRDLKRVSLLPDVQTFAEQGFEAVSHPLWFGLVAPAGTPDELIKQLHEIANASMRTAAFQQRVEAGAATYSPSSPEQFRVEIQRWLTRFKKVVEEAHIKIE